MKKILIVLTALLVAQSAYADTCAKSLTGVFTSFQASKICSIGVPTVTGNLTFTAASAKILPGVTSLLFRDTADANTNISITDAGIVTLRNDLVNSTAAKGVVLGEASRAANVTTATTLAAPIYDAAAASGTDLAAFVGFGASASGPVVDLFKTRAVTGAATTIVQSGDTLGTVKFFGANGTTYDPAASIKVTSDATPGAATDMPGAIDFLTTPDGSVTLTSALKLNSSQNAVFGGSASIPGGIINPTANEESVAGAGTTVADASALSVTKHIHQITGANGTVGWKFASSAVGQVEILLNTTAGVPKIYAVSGGSCNGGGADVACTLTTGIFAHICWASAANAWICS